MDYKRLLKRLVFPPLWVILVLAVICAVSLTAIFVKGWDTHPLASVFYALSFYTLTVVCVACWFKLPSYYKSAKEKAHSDGFMHRYITDAAFKTGFSLYRSLTVNLVYVAVNLLSGILYGSTWFFVLAVYYFILALMRFLLVRYVRKNKIGSRRYGELKRSRLCGWILITVNLALTAAVMMILYVDKGYDYHGILIYVMAAYTFYITVTAIINLVKYKKYRSPVMSTARLINLVAALVSMLNLETAMLAQFGKESGEGFRRIMVASTGGGIAAIIISLSVYVIVRNTMEIRKIKAMEKING
ncbi:MAG: hypothetical protein IKM27_02220 [Clostridia bacterium]|nr:hypothetical protein [Clostridia bacterium]